MGPDNYQQAWHAQSSQTRVSVDADLLLREVKRNQRDFRALIFRRDVIEVAVALLLLPVWFYMGLKYSLPWTWYLTVPALLWVAGFLVVDRLRTRSNPKESSEPLLKTVQDSLAQLEHQIWLLRNLVWWYLLPFAIPMLAYFVHTTWLASQSWLEVLALTGFFCAVTVACNAFIYYMNQRAVRLRLEPRRQELLALLAGLGEESTDEHAVASREPSGASSRKLWRWIMISVAVACLVLFAIVLASGLLDSSYEGPARSGGPAGDALARLVTDLRKEKNLVGLAAMVMVDGQVEAVAAQGERAKGSGVPLEIGDRWHLGGISKSITATMLARLVESGQMQWSDSVGECFPDAAIHQAWKPVTLRQLLTDTAGAPANFPKAIWRLRPALGPECTQARREAVLNVLADQPAYPPGEMFAYSNVGYTIAGAMAEKVTGVAWEDLVKREVFQPLNLTQAGFGPPKSADETLEQPRGHRAFLGGKVSVDDETDNSPIMGPAATVHMALADLCTFATEHMRGERGAGKLLSAETWKLLHTPAIDHYACGWLKRDATADFPYTAYWHNGSNTLWYALVVFIPEKNMVVAVTSNDGDSEQAEAAAWEIVKASVTQFHAGADPPSREPPQAAD